MSRIWKEFKMKKRINIGLISISIILLISNVYLIYRGIGANFWRKLELLKIPQILIGH